MVISTLLNGFSLGALLFVLTSGFTITFGLMRIVNLAHGAIYLVGGYSGLTVSTWFGNFWLALLGGAIVGGVVGFVCERFLLRRVRGQILPEVLLTVGLAMVLADGSLAIWGGTPQSVPIPESLANIVNVLGTPYPMFRIVIILLSLAIFGALLFMQYRTRVGSIVRAGIEQRETVSALGINIDRVFSIVFIFGAALAGVAGVIGGALLTLSPGEDTKILLFALVVVILGGAGSLPGVAVGSVLIGLIDSFSRIYVPEFAYFTIFAPMLIVLVVRPKGLFGARV